MSDVSEQAKALAADLYPAVRTPIASAEIAAQRAIGARWVQRDTLIAELEAQGWTPPPDPWEVIARSVWLFLFPGGEWLAPEFGSGDVACNRAIESQRNLVQYMREVFTEDEARAIAGRIEGES